MCSLEINELAQAFKLILKEWRYRIIFFDEALL